MNDTRRFVSLLCESLKDSTGDRILETAMAIDQRCRLTERQSVDCVELLTKLATDIITQSLDLCIEIIRDQERRYDRGR